MGSLEDRLRRLEVRERPQQRSSRNSAARARMRAVLDEIAAARREGREPSPEAVAVGEAIERRRSEARES